MRGFRCAGDQLSRNPALDCVGLQTFCEFRSFCNMCFEKIMTLSETLSSKVALQPGQHLVFTKPSLSKAMAGRKLTRILDQKNALSTLDRASS